MRFILSLTIVILAIALGVFLVQHTPPDISPPSPSATSLEATFYIDATNGRDENDGHSEDTAWKSLGRLLRAPLVPGTSVLLRRGQIWRESLNLTTSGENAAPITFGAYGEGEPPSVRGSDAFTSPSVWRYEGEGLWYIDNIRQDPGMLIRDGRSTIRRANKEDLAEAWDFWYDVETRRLYVRLDVNPAAMAELIEVPMREFVIGPLTASHVRLTGLDLRHPIRTTLLLWEADNVVLEDCGFTQSPKSHVQIGQGSNFVRISGCRFDDWNLNGGQGYAIQAVEAGSGPTDVEDCTFTATHPGSGSDHTAIQSEEKGWIRAVRRCRFLGKAGALAGSGIVMWGPSGAASSINIEDNHFEDLGGSAIVLSALQNYGADVTVAIGRNWIRNVCERDYPDQDALRIQQISAGLTSPVTLSCNVVLGTAQGEHAHAGIGIQDARGVRVLHNGIAGADDGLALRIGTSEIFIANNILTGNRDVGIKDEMGGAELTHNAYHENGGGDRGGQSSETGAIVEALRLDGLLRPLPGSPCIDGGIETEIVEDFDHQRLPVGSGPDIGPYEFSPSAP